MRFKRISITFLLCVCVAFVSNAQFKKIDTTMKVGKSGYRIYCNNKGLEKNTITITPVGFESGAREVSFEIKGKVAKAEADDLNNDGFPDMVVYVYTGDGNVYGKVIGIYSDKNTDIRPIMFPDILDDPKLKIGYKGHDEFSLMEGSLMRRFPVYQNPDSTNASPSGVIRQIQYRVMPGERETLQFKVLRSYEYKKPQ